MRSKMIPRKLKLKAFGEAAPPALPTKTTEEEEDPVLSTSSSLDDGAKCQSRQRKASGAQRKKNDAALILGLPCCGLRVPHYSSPIKLSKLHHRFGAKLSFDRKVVTKLIRQLVQSDDPCDVEDTSFPSCPPQMLICLDNINEIGRYNWAAAVTEMTLRKFDDFVTVVREKRSGRNTTPKRRIAGGEHGNANIFGFSAALAVWFLEHTRLRQPIDREAIPRPFRWGSILDKKLSCSIDSLQGQQLATKEKITITGVSQEKMHVQTEGVATPPHPALMGLLQGLGDEIRLLPERLQQSKSSDEAHFEALTTASTMGFKKIEKLISSTSMAQDQPTFGTDAKKFFSTPPSLTPAPAYDDANASVLIVEQGIIVPDPVSVVPTTALIIPTSLIKNIMCRDDRQPGMYDQSPFRRLDKAPKKQTAYQRKKGNKAMSKLLRLYKEWTCKSEASERQRAVEAFLAEEGYVDHNHTVLTFTNDCSLKWSHIWDILWGNMMDDETKRSGSPYPKFVPPMGIPGTIFCSWIMLTDGSNDDRAHKLHTCLDHEKLGCPLSDFQFLFFVVHVSNNWFLLSLQLEQCRIIVYNSCRGHATYDTCARNWEPILKAYLRYEGYRNADEF
ncbi:hypothetical protein Taro_023219 [Colocasia esculenta]|uniref:Uncharacterized protein n=1 Tax=Colocasia esculenta TaxID=4460 RepID=A0A843V430_COLES|nr:hypothetical protein [Colocasia esculenta]